MSERYTKLYILPRGLCAEGSPVVILGGNLLKDNQTGRVLAQIVFQNMDSRTIEALKVAVTCADPFGAAVDGIPNYAYLDLNAAKGQMFGQKTAVPLPSSSTRRFTVSIKQIVFTDNSVWSAEDALWEPLPASKPLGASLEDPELVQQYRLTYGDPCPVLPQAHKDLWLCTCGAWSRSPQCCRCGRSRDVLLSFDLETLKADRDARLMREQAERQAKAAAAKAAAQKAAAQRAAAQRAAAQQAEAEAARKQAARKKRRKVAIALAIILPLVALCTVGAVLLFTVVLPERAYDKAVALYNDGQYDAAWDAFETLNGYKNSAEWADIAWDAKLKQDRLDKEAREEAEREAAYNKAVALQEAEQYEEAMAAFTALGDYKDCQDQIQVCLKGIDYTRAKELYSNKKYIEAAQIFLTMPGFKNSDGYYEECMKGLTKSVSTVSGGEYHTVALKADGTVIAAGANGDGRCNVSAWKDMAAVAAGQSHTVGLKTDGTVVAVGNNKFGQCNVSEWTGVIAVAAGQLHTVGLKIDGTVVAVGNNKFGQCDVSDWTNIVAVTAGYNHTVGLKADGTVVAVGNNNFKQCDVSRWSNIVAIAAGERHTVGLKASGTVVAVGSDQYGQCKVSAWKDVTAIAAGQYHTVALRSNGTATATGDTRQDKCSVAHWRNVAAIAAGAWNTVGVKSNGTAVSTKPSSKDYDFGQCDVSSWQNLRMPESN